MPLLSFLVINLTNSPSSYLTNNQNLKTIDKPKYLYGLTNVLVSLNHFKPNN